MSRSFGAVIIGDELLSRKRQDKHFAKIAEILGQRGLRLSWVEYLGDDRAHLTARRRHGGSHRSTDLRVGVFLRAGRGFAQKRIVKWREVE